MPGLEGGVTPSVSLNGVQLSGAAPVWAAVVAQLDRTQAERFHRPLVVAALDVLADAEGIVDQEEHAADDVAHQGLRAEADGDADDPGAGDQRADLDAERGQDHQAGNHGEDDGDDDFHA